MMLHQFSRDKCRMAGYPTFFSFLSFSFSQLTFPGRVRNHRLLFLSFAPVKTVLFFDRSSNCLGLVHRPLRNCTTYELNRFIYLDTKRKKYNIPNVVVLEICIHTFKTVFKVWFTLFVRNYTFDYKSFMSSERGANMIKLNCFAVNY